MSAEKRDVTAQQFPYGIDVVNDEGMPCVRISRLSTIKRNQFFRVQTERGWLDFRVTPTGLIRVDTERQDV